MAGRPQNRAESDPLTRLYGRGFFQKRLRQEVDEAPRKERSLGLCVLGLDRFREINHTFGPHYGDALLRDVARRFARVTDGFNARARLNGDEFAALFPDVTTAEVEAICADILRALDSPFTALGVPVDISGSIGAALFPDHGEKSSLLFQRAAIALDQAKHFGRRYAVYEPENDPYSQKKTPLLRRDSQRHRIESIDIALSAENRHLKKAHARVRSPGPVESSRDWPGSAL